MKLTKLKIGNYIHGKYFDDEDNEQKAVCEVLAIDSVDTSIWVNSHINREWFNDFEGIKIDDKWLENFGFFMNGVFKLDLDKYLALIKSHGYYYPQVEQYPDITGEQRGIGREEIVSLPRVKYVHQLQNLLDVLKGDE